MIPGFFMFEKLFVVGCQFFFGTRMGLLVGGFELLEGGVSIDLRGGETAVSEEGLDGVDVCTVVEHLRGEGVS